MINYSIWYFLSFFFYFLHSNVLDNKCHKQKWHVLFFTCIKLVASVLICALVTAHIKWIRLFLLVLWFNITHTITKTHSKHRHQQTDTLNKYIVATPVMSSQQLSVLHWMNNFLISKIYFIEFHNVFAF